MLLYTLCKTKYNASDRFLADGPMEHDPLVPYALESEFIDFDKPWCTLSWYVRILSWNRYVLPKKLIKLEITDIFQFEVLYLKYLKELPSRVTVKGPVIKWILNWHLLNYLAVISHGKWKEVILLACYLRFTIKLATPFSTWNCKLSA